MRRDELKHFGIPGQKWGVRRFQNPDGTLTEAGRKRYLKEANRDMEQYFKSRISSEAAKVTSIGRNGYEQRGDRWTKAYRQGKVTRKDSEQIKKAAKETRAYMNQKYGKEVVKALARSGVLFRPIDDFKIPTNSKIDGIANQRKIPKNSKIDGNTNRRERVEQWNNVKTEANKLFKKYPQLKKDFGSYDQIDDFDLFDYVLQEYGIKADNYHKAFNEYDKLWR